MKPFYSEASDFSPRADFNNLTGVFELTGVSMPENVSVFYLGLIKWLREFDLQYLSTGKLREGSITLNFRLTYLNSASSKYILQMLEIVKTWIKYGVKPQINWYFDENDEEMKEDGRDLSEALEYGFNFLTMT